MPKLSDREKICVTFAALQEITGVKINWAQIYAQSRNKQIDAITNNPKPNSVSLWKNTASVANFFAASVENINNFINREIEKARNKLLDEIEQQANATGCSSGDLTTEIQPTDNSTRDRLGETLSRIRRKNSGIAEDFTERENLINALNELAINAKDSREKIDTLKIIADLQRFKDLAKQEDNEIKRFYMPLKCSDCVLYQKAKAKQEQKTNADGI
jgi:hypothetical protein|nr:MAG TPA_asm: hypothetical protein [Caudoviricetes sp.]